jgi:hypothetical protein
MAIYHLSTKPISRSSGRSAVASIAYRAGIAITDERLGKTYDYTKRHGVLWTGLATPNDVKIDRKALWNLAEKSENRSNSRTAREIVINIPHELMQGDQGTGKMLAYEFASQLSEKYQVAVDVAVHAPDKQGDNRNFHAHLLLTTRKIEQDRHGKIKLTDKSQLEMSNTQLKQAGLLSNQDELKEIRKAWADLTNEYLAEHGIDERIDHRSHKDRGLDTLPTVKMGWQATELERNGIRTDVGDKNRDIKAYNASIALRDDIQKQLNQSKDKYHDSEQRPLYSTSRPYEATAGRADSLQQERGGVLQESSQYSRRSENHDTEQQPLHSTSQTDRETGARIDSLQQSRGGLLQESIPTSSQSKSRSGATKPREPRLTANEQQARKYHDELWEQQRAERELFKANLDNAQKRTENAIEPRQDNQDNSARVVPPTPIRPHNERVKLDIAEKTALIREYSEKVQATAKQILDNQLKALREKAKPILDKYNTLKDNKPLLFGKKQWEQDTNKTLEQYNAIKNTHDSMKDKGVTDEHTKQAIDQIAKQDPSYHAQVQQAIKDVKAFEQAKLDKLAREHGADKIAQNGNFYYGKIIKINDKGAYQQTNDGIVLHPTYANSKSLTLGKNYDLDYRETEKTGQVYSRESYEISLPTKSQERHR